MRNSALSFNFLPYKAKHLPKKEESHDGSINNQRLFYTVCVCVCVCVKRGQVFDHHSLHHHHHHHHHHQMDHPHHQTIHQTFIKRVIDLFIKPSLKESLNNSSKPFIKRVIEQFIKPSSKESLNNSSNL